MKTRREQLAGCVHYTPLNLRRPKEPHRCAAGVLLNDVMDKSAVLLARFPCFAEGIHLACPSRQFKTEAELDAEEEADSKFVADYLAKLARGECPTCGAGKDRRVRRAPCVYCSACGTRLYQGRP